MNYTFSIRETYTDPADNARPRRCDCCGRPLDPAWHFTGMVVEGGARVIESEGRYCGEDCAERDLRGWVNDHGIDSTPRTGGAFVDGLAEMEKEINRVGRDRFFFPALYPKGKP